MSRLVVPAALLLAFPAAAPAQFFQPRIQQSGFGGGFQPIPQMSPVPVPLAPVMVPSAPRYTGGFLGGFITPGYTGPGFPFSGIWGGYGGWYGYGWGGGYPYYGYSGYQSPYASPFQPPVVGDGPAELPPSSGPTIALANEFPATLTMEFPAAAEVWVNGKKAEGSAATEWTLTSPVMKSGESFKFEVKARWAAGGKTYEAERSVSVASGNRSRVLVIAGTQVKE